MIENDVELLGPFSIYEQIGSGGMAVVHRAIEKFPNGTKRVVALKRLHKVHATNELYVDAFVREATITGILDHPNIPETYDHGPIPGSHYISMEFIQGHSVLEALRTSKRSPIPIHVVVSLLQDLFAGLHYMHTKIHDGEHLKLIHRDITPANLIIETDGRLRIIDFGVAKAALAGMQTSGNMVKGKLSYLAPESLNPLVRLDARSDLFSAGVVAHELVSGRALFSPKKTRAQTIDSLLKNTIAPPSQFNDKSPPSLDALIMRTLQRNRDERISSAEVMLEGLDEIAQSLPTAASHEQVALWCESTFGPTDHTTCSAQPSEAAVPEYDSYEVQTPRKSFPPRRRFPAHSGVPIAEISTESALPMSHLSLLAPTPGKRESPTHASAPAANRFPLGSRVAIEITRDKNSAPQPSFLTLASVGKRASPIRAKPSDNLSQAIRTPIVVTFRAQKTGGTPLPELVRQPRGTAPAPSTDATSRKSTPRAEATLQEDDLELATDVSRSSRRGVIVPITLVAALLLTIAIVFLAQ